VPDNPPILAEYPIEGRRLYVSLFSHHSRMVREIVSDALRVTAGHPDASKIQPGESIVVGDEVLIAMEPKTPEAATSIRDAAEQVLGRALPSDVDVLALDLPHSLIIKPHNRGAHRGESLLS